MEAVTAAAMEAVTVAVTAAVTAAATAEAAMATATDHPEAEQVADTYSIYAHL